MGEDSGDWLLKAGNGLANSAGNDIQIDPTMKYGETVDSLLFAIYPGLDTLDPNADMISGFQIVLFCAPGILL